MDKIKVLVVSQHPLFRQGVWHSLSTNDDMVVMTAETSDEMLAEIEKSSPDVAVIDIDSYPDEGIQLSSQSKQKLPDMGLILLTSKYDDDDQLFQALKVQASAYVKKEVTPEELVEAIRGVAHGKQPIQQLFTTRQKVATEILHKFQELTLKMEKETDDSLLTSRETEVLNYVARGYLNKQIAGELGISEQTIKNHVTSILRKLNAGARTEAVVLAIRRGIINIS